MTEEEGNHRRSLHNEPLTEQGREDRRMLFVAIARGVVKHLQQNVNDGLVVTYDAGYRANVSINME